MYLQKLLQHNHKLVKNVYNQPFEHEVIDIDVEDPDDEEKLHHEFFHSHSKKEEKTEKKEYDISD